MTTKTLPTGTGVVSSYTHDNAGRLTAISHVKGGSTTLASVAYTLDDVGNRTQRVDQQGTHTYAYDDVYRLTSVTYPGPATTSYTFDGFGNRLTKTDASGTTNYAYDDADRLTSVDPPGAPPAVTYTWDNNGNLTNRGSDTFAWDYEDRMTSATVAGTTTTFAYRGDGLRDSRTTGGNTTTFTWDIAAGLPVVIDDGTYGFVWGDGLLSQISASGTHYYLSDGLGSTMGMVDGSGQVVRTLEYDVYGKATNGTGSVSAQFDFAGQQTDPTGLQYLRARYVDPQTGTFLSRDGLTAVGGFLQHPFGYAEANPVMFSDPEGTCVWKIPCPNPFEAAWCTAHFYICAQAGIISSKAFGVAAEYFPSAHGYEGVDDLRDAFRHCYWSGMLTLNWGPKIAKSLTDAHEKSANNNSSDRAKEMDYYNNQVERTIGEYARDNWWDPRTQYSSQAVAEGCYKAAVGGELDYFAGPCGSCTDLPPGNSLALGPLREERGMPPPANAQQALSPAVLARLGDRRTPRRGMKPSVGHSALAVILLCISALVILVSVVWIFFGFIGGLGPDTTDYSLMRGLLWAGVLGPLAILVAWAQAVCAFRTSGVSASTPSRSTVFASWIASAFDFLVAVGWTAASFAGVNPLIAVPFAVFGFGLSYATLAIVYPSLRLTF